MFKLQCNDYGFECTFEVEGDKESVTDKFKAHVYDEHGIDYTKEAVKQFILRKYPESLDV